SGVHRTRGTAGTSVPALRAGSGCVESRDRLHLEIFLETVLAPFAAVAGLLVAAERRGAIVRHALQIDVAGADLAADAARAFHGITSHVAGENIGRVVGDLDGVGFI